MRAWVGGRDFEALQVDLVSASGSGGRQPGSTFKPGTLAEATVNSVNTVCAQAVMQVGAGAVVDMANRLGADRELEPRPSIALGAQEVSVLEMATVYSTFSPSGTRMDPYLMTEIEDRDGVVIWGHEVDEEQAVGPGDAE